MIPADRMPLTPHLVQVFHRPTFQQRSPPLQSAGRMLLLRGGSIPFRHHWVIFKPSLTWEHFSCCQDSARASEYPGHIPHASPRGGPVPLPRREDPLVPLAPPILHVRRLKRRAARETRDQGYRPTPRSCPAEFCPIHVPAQPPAQPRPSPLPYRQPAPASVRRRRRGRVRPLVLWVSLTFAGAALLATQRHLAIGRSGSPGCPLRHACGGGRMGSSLDNLGQALEGLDRSLRAAR